MALVIESVSTTQDKDNVGETLELDGADISQLKRGFVNADHVKGFSELLGRVIDCKKIYSRDDCETPYQFKKWDELKRPFLWTKWELFDGWGHTQADSLAAIYRFYQSKNQEPPVKISVEGRVLERNGKRLTRTLIRGIAATVTPCNVNTSSEVVDVMKSQKVNQYYLDALAKSDAPNVPVFCEMSQDRIARVHAMAAIALEMIRAAKKY